MMNVLYRDKGLQHENGIYSSGVEVHTAQVVQDNGTNNIVFDHSGHPMSLSQQSGNVILLQPGSRVVLPSMMNNEVIHSSGIDNEDQDMNGVLTDSYVTMNGQNMNPILMTYQSPGDIDLLDESDVKVRFANTLVGGIAKIMKEEKRPLNIEELCIRLNPLINDFRKMDGTRYKGNGIKAVNGALSSTGIFQHLDDGKWAIKEEEFEIYEQRIMKKLESRFKRKRPMNVLSEEERAKRKYSKRRDRKQTIISVLDNIREIQRQVPSERNSVYFQNPFHSVTGLEDCDGLQNKLGHNRFMICMQLYAYFEDIFKVATGDVRIDLQQVVDSGNDFNNKRIVRLKMEIEDVRKRITQLEKYT